MTTSESQDLNIMVRIGDVFRINQTFKGREFCWEVVDLKLDECRISYDYTSFWYRTEWLLDTTEWTYVGNFAKSSNFNNLYDILCS